MHADLENMFVFVFWLIKFFFKFQSYIFFQYFAEYFLSSINGSSLEMQGIQKRLIGLTFLIEM